MSIDVLDNIEKLVRIFAIIVGGIWVYAKAIRGRIFIPRIQIHLSGKIIKKGESHYILANVKIENVGSSIVEIQDKKTGLKLGYMYRYSKFKEQLTAKGLIKKDEAMGLYLKKDETAFSVFNEYGRIRKVFSLIDFKINDIRTVKIEPKTTLSDEKLIEIPADKYDAFRLKLRVSALGTGILLTRNLQLRHKIFSMEQIEN